MNCLKRPGVRSALASLFIVILGFVTPSLAAPGPATATTDASEWRMRGGNVEGWHFSKLHQIDASNISRLRLGWFANMPSRDGAVGTPLVANGLVYQVGTLNIVYANDVRTGKLVWTFDPKVHLDGTLLSSWGARVKRGLALWQDEVLLTTGDCRLVAINAHSGKELWQSRACEQGGYTINSAPRVGGGMVFVGPTNTILATNRGFVAAFDALTGKPLWRFYTIPADPTKGEQSAAMLMAAKTWDPEHLKHAAGACAWEDMTYDPVTKLLYVGTGGASPWNPAERGSQRGDELFTNSIIALNAATGEYVWHYQVTPRDGWNLEATMPMAIAELRIGGVQRRVVMEATKNGFFYVLDTHTGKLVNRPGNFVPVNWARGIDFKTGRPDMDPQAEYWSRPEGAVVMPGPLGAHSFNPMSYNPTTGLVYIPAIHLPTRMSVEYSSVYHGNVTRTDFYSNLAESRAPLIAWDPVRQVAKWKKDLPLPLGGGVLSTAGNLVFEGSGDGVLNAYRATDGKQLWSFDTGSGIQAAPVSVEVDGTQVVLVTVGNGGTSSATRAYPAIYHKEGVNGPPRLLAFRLDGEASLPAAVAPAPFPRPPRPRPPQELAQTGKLLFEAKMCDLCHGFDAQVQPGSVPDLRKASAQVHDTIEAIVRGGARQDKGMPMFMDRVSSEELKALQAFILSQAWDAYEAQAKVQQPGVAPQSPPATQH